MATILLLAAALAVLASDQAIKALVVKHLAEGQLVQLAGPSRLRRITNTRQPLSRAAATLVWLLALLLALILPLPIDAAAGLGLVLGGAAGNLVDRLARGGVVDYLSIGPWPTFNLADTAMVAGFALAVVQALFSRGAL